MHNIKNRIIIDYLKANGKEIDESLPHGFGCSIEQFKEGIHFYLMPNEMLVLSAFKYDYCENPIVYDMKSGGIEVKYENHKCWHSLIVLKHSFRLNTLLSSGVMNPDKIDSNGGALQRNDYFLAINENNGRVFVLRKDKCHLLYLGTSFADKAVLVPILHSHREGKLFYNAKECLYRSHGGYVYVESDKTHLVNAISEKNNLVQFSTKRKYFEPITEIEYENRVYLHLLSRNYDFEIKGELYGTVPLVRSQLIESMNKQKAHTFFYFGKLGKIVGYRIETREYLMRNISDKEDIFIAKECELKSIVKKTDI